MVVKRSCSFCAGEIEPGTGMMYVKRDGSIYHFCSSSCRKQQLHLGRVGHRLKWTRAHAIKRQTEQSSAAGKAAGKHKPAIVRSGSRSAAAPAEPPKEPAKAPTESEGAEPAPKAAEPTPGAHVAAPASAETPAAAAKKPRAKKPKDAPDAAPPS
ncbi:MAG TPA: 50S ribosomal protein L24e [Thermoplasmata archaeon]|nr:50S ribosomal protein L24e [Thermoplasmata archaeon]